MNNTYINILGKHTKCYNIRKLYFTIYNEYAMRVYDVTMNNSCVDITDITKLKSLKSMYNKSIIDDLFVDVPQVIGDQYVVFVDVDNNAKKIHSETTGIGWSPSMIDYFNKIGKITRSGNNFYTVDFATTTWIIHKDFVKFINTKYNV